MKSSSPGSAAKKAIIPATVMAASSHWLVSTSSNGSRSRKTISLGQLVARESRASSLTKSTYRGLNRHGATSFRRLGHDPAMEPVRGAREAEVELSERRGGGRMRRERRQDVLRPAVEL
jgi:hypothetical protein